MTDADFRERLRMIYAAADAAVAQAGPRCEASGRCCRFEEFGHTLFLSQFEADVLLVDAPSYVQPVDRAGCPFQIDNLCTARDARPLGCRIYFCDSAYESTSFEITETAIAALKQLADDADLPWHYAPLHSFLNEHVPSLSNVAASPRISLL